MVAADGAVGQAGDGVSAGKGVRNEQTTARVTCSIAAEGAIRCVQGMAGKVEPPTVKRVIVNQRAIAQVESYAQCNNTDATTAIGGVAVSDGQAIYGYRDVHRGSVE